MIICNWNDTFMQFGSLIATIMLFKGIYEQYIPYQWKGSINTFFLRYTERLVRIFSPYNSITFEEFTGERFNRSEAYKTIQVYLGEKTSKKARGLKASFVEDGKGLVLGLADNEEVSDEFDGVTVWWTSHKSSPKTQMITYYPGTADKRHYQLKFHSRHRDFVTKTYLNHILAEGKAIAVSKRQRKLFTNVKEQSGSSSRGSLWSHVEFKHPSSFRTLAMEKSKKQSIIDDLERFKEAKDYYAQIGKPWKRGYLLYGPPGTGKSTMIAAMANLFKYDVYDLELTGVKDNTQLRRLLIETSSKSIIVIEDFDCSLDLTGQRSSQKEKKDEDKEQENPIKKKLKEQEGGNKKSEVTLSGLLNFIDGIWSACGEERLIIFTTNYIDKLDPALIRRGRMDVHIELSYCCYEAFLVLAKNYLDLDDHILFEEIRTLLSETKICPADVAELLMPKSLQLDLKTKEASLKTLVGELERKKEADNLKAIEDEKLKERTKLEEDEEKRR